MGSCRQPGRLGCGAMLNPNQFDTGVTLRRGAGCRSVRFLAVATLFSAIACAGVASAQSISPAGIHGIDLGETSSARGLCPGAGDCCAAHGGLGCGDFDCCDWVCFIDDFCCKVEWNEDCASYASLFCPEICEPTVGCGSGDCCSEGTQGCDDAECCEAVCNADVTCCLGAWGTECTQLAHEQCTVCPEPAVCPQPGACCESHLGSGGCERAACCETVCQIDPTCCTGGWGFSCARAARENCLNVCDCDQFGDFDGDLDHDLADLADFLACFNGSNGGDVSLACACADYDGDGDADLTDFSQLFSLISGP